MPFDRTNPADLQALQTEVNTDPIGMGYAAVIEQTTLLLKLLNDPANNVGGETAQAILSPRLILDVISPDDLTPSGQFSQGELEWVKMLVHYGLIEGDPDANLEQFRAKFTNVFPANSTTRIDLVSRTAPLSRAEVLFGQGTELTREDWFAARDFVP